LHGDRPGARGALGVDQQVARDPEQPRPDWPVIGTQLRQVAPGADEGLLHDVLGARPVWAEPCDAAVQRVAVTSVELTGRFVGVAGQRTAGGITDSSHDY
jgi:hypothetical protein